MGSLLATVVGNVDPVVHKKAETPTASFADLEERVKLGRSIVSYVGRLTSKQRSLRPYAENIRNGCISIYGMEIDSGARPFDSHEMAQLMWDLWHRIYEAEVVACKEKFASLGIGPFPESK